jgi:hypothetical protein
VRTLLKEGTIWSFLNQREKSLFSFRTLDFELPERRGMAELLSLLYEDTLTGFKFFLPGEKGKCILFE